LRKPPLKRGFFIIKIDLPLGLTKKENTMHRDVLKLEIKNLSFRQLIELYLDAKNGTVKRLDETLNEHDLKIIDNLEQILKEYIY